MDVLCKVKDCPVMQQLSLHPNVRETTNPSCKSLNFAPTVAAGFELQTASADSYENDTDFSTAKDVSALIRFETNNITLQQPQLVDVRAPHVKNLLDITGANITVQGLVSSGCAAEWTVLVVRGRNNELNLSSYTTSTNARFSNSNMRAVEIAECSSDVVDSVFGGMSVTNGDGAAILATNLDYGGKMNLTNCSFKDNIAIETTEPHKHDHGCVAPFAGCMRHLVSVLCVVVIVCGSSSRV